MSRIIHSAALLAALFAVACGGDQAPSEPITVDGSSTLFPLTDTVARDFMTTNRGVHVDVASSGTVPGLARFCAAELDIADASRPITPDEQQACADHGVTFIELPVALDGVTVIVNPRNDWASDITVDELRTLWSPDAKGSVTTWSQIRPAWPDREIHLAGPGTESGTFDFFTRVIVGETGSSRTDYMSSADDAAIVDAVADDELALAYVGLGWAERNRDRVKALGLDDLDDAVGPGAVVPSVSTVARGLYRPLSRPVFIYVNTQRIGKPGLDTFATYYLRTAAQLAAKGGMAPMTSGAYELAQQRLSRGVTGTMYTEPDSLRTHVEFLLAR